MHPWQNKYWGGKHNRYINFLFYYYPVKKRMHDRLSRWIREIKDGDLVLSLAFSIYIFKRIRFDQGCISRALKHDELFVNPSDEQVTPVDILGLMLENDEVAYRPD